MFKGRKEIYKEVITSVVKTANYEQIHVNDAIYRAIEEYSLTITEVNEIWSIMFYCVKDEFNQYCYHFVLDNEKMNKFL